MVSLHAVGLRDLREFELNCSLRFQSKGARSFVKACAPRPFQDIVIGSHWRQPKASRIVYQSRH